MYALRLAGVLVSIGAGALVARSVDLDAALDLVVRANALLLAAGLAGIAVQTVLLAIRWRWLLPLAPDGELVPLATSLRVLVLGTLVNFGLPGRVGDAARALLIRRAAGVSAVSGVGSIVVERGLDLAALSAAGLASGLATRGPAIVVNISAVLLAGSVLGLTVLWSGIVSKLVAMLRERLERGRLRGAIGPLQRLSTGVEIARARGHLVQAAVLTAGSVLLDGVVVWLAAASIGVALGPLEALLAGVAAILMTAVPSAPANLGTFELAATFVLTAFGVTAEAALAVAVIAHALVVLPVAVAGLVILARGAGGAPLPEPSIAARGASDDVRAGTGG